MLWCLDSHIDRIRHIKCDEAKPICARCRQFGYNCEGYTYGSSTTTLPSNSRSSQAPPVPISRLQSQPRALVEIPRSSAAIVRQGQALCSPKAQSRPSVHVDDDQSLRAISGSRKIKNLVLYSSSVGNESRASVELAEKQQVSNRDNPIVESELSPKLSPTADEYIERAFRFGEFSVPPLSKLGYAFIEL
jgi:Fungal Zn(2)-Cys(6) binuclear cluster domain